MCQTHSFLDNSENISGTLEINLMSMAILNTDDRGLFIFLIDYSNNFLLFKFNTKQDFQLSYISGQAFRFCVLIHVPPLMCVKAEWSPYSLVIVFTHGFSPKTMVLLSRLES